MLFLFLPTFFEKIFNFFFAGHFFFYAPSICITLFLIYVLPISTRLRFRINYPAELGVQKYLCFLITQGVGKIFFE